MILNPLHSYDRVLELAPDNTTTTIPVVVEVNQDVVAPTINALSPKTLPGHCINKDLLVAMTKVPVSDRAPVLPARSMA